MNAISFLLLLPILCVTSAYTSTLRGSTKCPATSFADALKVQETVTDYHHLNGDASLFQDFMLSKCSPQSIYAFHRDYKRHLKASLKLKMVQKEQAVSNIRFDNRSNKIWWIVEGWEDHPFHLEPLMNTTKLNIEANMWQPAAAPRIRMKWWLFAWINYKLRQ